MTQKPAYFSRLLVALSLLLLPTTARAEGEPCGNPGGATLMAGQTIEAGHVTVWNDETNLFVRYEASGDWAIGEMHLAVATSLDGIPQTKKGNPIPGRFPYATTSRPGVREFVYVIDRTAWEPTTELFIAAHAALDSPTLGRETGWADGQDFPGANWATYFTFRLQYCGTPPE